MRPTSGQSMRKRAGFTMVETLVVIGIMVVLMGLMIPVVMRARRASRTTQCMSNLRQIGVLYQIYANANNGCIPMGTTALPDQPGYHTAFNNYLWANGPGSAAGSLLLANLVGDKEASIFYCPLERKDEMSFDLNRTKVTEVLMGDRTTPKFIKSSFSSRPINSVWQDKGSEARGGSPWPFPKLLKMKRLALVAENPQIEPWNHGSESDPQIHVMYADGMVALVHVSVFRQCYDRYLTIAAPDPPGMTPPSNLQAVNEQDPTAKTIWHNLDLD